MEGFLKLSTARSVPILMVDSADHITGKTGLTLTITARKPGGSFASITPTVTEVAHGWYDLAFTTAHVDTLGDLILHITAAGADPTDLKWQVVTHLPGEVNETATASAVWEANYFDYLNNLDSIAWQLLVTQPSDFNTRIGIPTGASVTADIVAVKAVVDAILAQTGTSGVKVLSLLDATGLAPARVGTFQAGSTTTVFRLDASASAMANFYNGMRIVITSGAMKGQARIITSYDGVTKNVTLNNNVNVAPAGGDSFVIMSVDESGNTVTSPTAVQNAAAVWDRLVASHMISGSFGWEFQEMEARVQAFLPVTVPTAIQNADALLKRDWTLVTGEATRSLLNAMRGLRNKSDIVAGILIVMKEDDTTEAWRANVSTDANAEPIIGVDPTT